MSGILVLGAARVPPTARGRTRCEESDGVGRELGVEGPRASAGSKKPVFAADVGNEGAPAGGGRDASGAGVAYGRATGGGSCVAG
jgi:hypothetical protein